MAAWIPLSLGPPPRTREARALWDTLTSAGMSVTRRAWPDFLAFTEHGLVLVRIKGRRGRKPKVFQEYLMATLALHYGVPCFTWSEAEGFKPLRPNPEAYLRPPLPIP